ncbi:nucleoside deaminase [Pelomonas sp. KK5]|uniref:nucleoside deaminase n=1 Tax=Pelomonas sp. KK5 TaxID=1855730 RepID=UPI0009FA2C48|nr:nucleoside deaminase [Pelomonas sp. KK5]
MNELSDTDALYLRRAIELGAATGRRGNRPFGAVIVSADGQVLGEGVNDNASTGDCTAHAEINALRAASPRHGRELLAAATLYSSGEPCVMCAGAIFWSNVRRVVFGIDAVSLREFRATQAGAGDVVMPCRDVFAAAPHAIEAIGPALLDEAAAPHHDFWKV